MFLDGNLMDIMIGNGEIWCKLSAMVMIYIHWRTPTFHLEWVFKPPPPSRTKIFWTAIFLCRGFPKRAIFCYLPLYKFMIGVTILDAESPLFRSLFHQKLGPNIQACRSLIDLERVHWSAKHPMSDLTFDFGHCRHVVIWNHSHSIFWICGKRLGWGLNIIQS